MPFQYTFYIIMASHDAMMADSHTLPLPFSGRTYRGTMPLVADLGNILLYWLLTKYVDIIYLISWY